jgi:pyruvate kinase
MVTMPKEAASDYDLVRDLLKSGMNVARINAAHEGPEEWLNMISNIHQASIELRRSCKILFDLEGPKLRTGQIETSYRNHKIKQLKDKQGSVNTPTLLIIYPEGDNVHSGEGYPLVPVDKHFIKNLIADDIIHFTDTRGKPRFILIRSKKHDYVLGELNKTCVINKGIELTQTRENMEIGRGHIGYIHTIDPFIVLKEGDKLKVTKPDSLGDNARYNDSGELTSIAHIPCTLPEVINQVKARERIFFDDGKIGGIVQEVNENEFLVKIMRCKHGGAKLRSDKGINLPDTELKVPALSSQDLEHLTFAVNHVDLIGLSFVKEPNDVELLQKEISKLTNKEIGIILKIETRSAFENLSQLLLTGLKKPPIGVMVARGDLGVEVGFERMSEVQEQILWLCEAAHIPVIWATQVLEQMNKIGLPTRGEVTDAAMSSRAECVMLNKGPFVVETVKFLDNILTRMMNHNNKKTHMLRKLKISEGRWTSTGLKK